MKNKKVALIQLRRNWLWVALIWLSALLVGYGVLRGVWEGAGRWLLLASGAALVALWQLWRDLAHNRADEKAPLRPDFGWGTRLTLLRGLAVAMMVGFLGSPRLESPFLSWLPMILYTVAAVADGLDGYVARRTRSTTLLGARLDMAYDGFGILMVILLAVWYGQLPAYYLVLGMARYLFLAGIWWRERRGLPLYPLPESAHRRAWAGAQMGFLSVVLWPFLPADGLSVGALIFGLPLALGFLRDWLITSGVFTPQNARYLRLQRFAFTWLTEWLPLLCRLIFVVGIVALYAQRPPLWTTLVTVMALPLTLLLLIGAGGRLGTLPLILPVALHIMANHLTFTNTLTLASLLFLTMMGSGLFSLWKWDDALFMRQLGGD